MTNIDFYILPGSDIAARDQFACRLAEKAVKSDHHVFIAVDDSDCAQQLSDGLWCFKPESFVAHAVQADDQEDAQVLLGWQMLSCQPSVDKCYVYRLTEYRPNQ